MPGVILTGQSGRIEAMYNHNASASSPLAIVLHPNPVQGGTMNNKVTHTMYKALSDSGYSTIRFNFRGVGKSEGTYDNGEGELNDTIQVLDWLQSVNQGDRVVLVAGYSFGAWIGMQLLMRRPEVKNFIAIAPPANLYDFSFLAPCPVSGLILNGEDDVICPVEYVEKLVEKLNSQKGLKILYKAIANCNHTFDGKIDYLKEVIVQYTSDCNCFANAG